MKRRPLLFSLALALGHVTLLWGAFGCASSAATGAGSATVGLASDSAAIVYLSGDDSPSIGRMVVAGETLATQAGAMLRFPDGSDVELDETTVVEVRSIARANGPTVTRLHLQSGAVRVNVPPRPTRGTSVIYQVTSPIATAGVRGTDFSVAYRPATSTASAEGTNGEAEIDVFEGTVEVDNGGAPDRVSAGRGATVTRRSIRRRAVAESIRERWENRREAIVERLRARMRLRPDDDVAEKLRERLGNLPAEKRQQIQERIRRIQVEQRARARARVEAARERRQDRRETGRPANPSPRPQHRAR